MSLILLCTGIDRSYSIEELHTLLTTVSPSCVLLNSFFLYVVFGVGLDLQYCRDVCTNIKLFGVNKRIAQFCISDTEKYL